MQLKLQKLASMPLETAYQELLIPLKFQYMQMKDQKTDKSYKIHAYSDKANQNLNPP